MIATASPAAPSALRIAVEGGIAVITFDLPGESVNKVNRAVKDELLATFDRLERDPAVRAVVLISGKRDTFIAGADIEEFLEIKTAGDAERLSRDGQTMLDRVERGKPVIAAIHGACLGGGLEAVLACAYRVATDHPKTVLALPEVQLGLIPGAGGTQRLPRLVGPARAKDLIFSGRFVDSAEALAIGLVDEVAPADDVYEAAVTRVKRYVGGPAYALRAAKEAIDQGLEADLATGLEIERMLFAGLFATRDREIGMTSFVEHGPGKAQFEGR
jgi:enoyl-CoA hydratase/carnithine racemase